MVGGKDISLGVPLLMVDEEKDLVAADSDAIDDDNTNNLSLVKSLPSPEENPWRNASYICTTLQFMMTLLDLFLESGDTPAIHYTITASQFVPAVFLCTLQCVRIYAFSKWSSGSGESGDTTYRLENTIQTGHWEELEDKLNEVRGVLQWESDVLFVSRATLPHP